MKILLIANLYHPVVNPRAFRWTSIAEYWASQGHHIDVVTSWQPGLAENEIRNEVTVYRAGKTVFQTVRIRLLKALDWPRVEDRKTGMLSRGFHDWINQAYQ